MKEYAFVTEWRLRAPLEEVWQAIKKVDEWPAWWSFVEQAELITAGDTDGVGEFWDVEWRTALPYSIHLLSRVVRIEQMRMIEIAIYGDLSGTGTFNFSIDDDATMVRYELNVHATKGWMNLLAPLAEPLFAWNHDLVMKAGGEGLAQRLDTQLLNISEQDPAMPMRPALLVAGAAMLLAVILIGRNRIAKTSG